MNPVSENLKSGKVTSTNPTVADVERFSEQNPLCAFESPFAVGSPEFFRWHDDVRRKDVEQFAFQQYEFDRHRDERVLDVGCGIGWICQHFAQNGARITGVDLTLRAVELTRLRLTLHGLSGDIRQANAESLPFPDGVFDFVVSAGVLHHTPRTEQAVAEIRRVLRPGGRGMIALYYRSPLFCATLWPITRWLVNRGLRAVPGRDGFRTVATPDDLVRMYDGNENPLGKCYSRGEMRALLDGFLVERLAVHYFPRRFVPLGNWMPRWVHAVLDRSLGLMIYATVRKAA